MKRITNQHLMKLIRAMYEDLQAMHQDMQAMRQDMQAGFTDAQAERARIESRLGSVDKKVDNLEESLEQLRTTQLEDSQSLNSVVMDNRRRIKFLEQTSKASCS